MAAIQKRASDGALYLRHSFELEKRRYFVTYQLYPETEHWLSAHGLNDGDTISDDLLDELRQQNLIFTGKSGIGEGIPSETETSERKSRLEGLSKNLERTDECRPQTNEVAEEIVNINPNESYIEGFGFMRFPTKSWIEVPREPLPEPTGTSLSWEFFTQEALVELFGYYANPSRELAWGKKIWSRMEIMGFTHYVDDKGFNAVLARLMALARCLQLYNQFAYEKTMGDELPYHEWLEALPFVERALPESEELNDDEGSWRIRWYLAESMIYGQNDVVCTALDAVYRDNLSYVMQMDLREVLANPSEIDAHYEHDPCYKEFGLTPEEMHAGGFLQARLEV